MAKKQRGWRDRIRPVKARFVCKITCNDAGLPVSVHCFTTNGGVYTHIHRFVVTRFGVCPAEVIRVSNWYFNRASKELPLFEVRP